MADYVDELLEQAFRKVEESDGDGSSKTPMDDIISEEARKNGVDVPSREDYFKKNSDSSRRLKRENSDTDRDDLHKRSSKRSREPRRDNSRTRSSRYSRSPSTGSKSRRSKDSRYRRSSRSRSPNRRRRSRDRYSNKRSDSREARRSPRRSSSPNPWRRSPPRVRLPGPERRDVMPFTPRRSPPRNAKLDMTVEERDERTIFILQLSRETRPRDLEEFFSSVGFVRDVRIITDSKTRRSKGIAYVEFWEKDGVALAMGLNGQKLCGAPLVIQMTCAERNRLANGSMGGAIGLGLPTDSDGSIRFCVSNLHAQITDDMLLAIFEPFGRIDKCEVIKDSNKVSKGYGHVIFRHCEEGKRALEQFNGFELAGKNIRITIMEELE